MIRLILLTGVFSLASVATLSAQPNPLIRPLPPGSTSTDVLARLLRDIGFEPKALSPDVLQVTLIRDQWPVHIMTSLSSDGRRIWLESKFAPIEEPDRAPAAAWRRLLETNEKIGPAHFAYDPRDRRVHLYKAFDNVNLSTERLRQEIDSFDLTVRSTQEVWRGDNFKPVIGSNESATLTSSSKPLDLATAPAAPVARPAADNHPLLGEWKLTSARIKGRLTPPEVVAERKARLLIRPARETDFGQTVPGRLMAELHTGPDTHRTVRLVLHPTPTGSGPQAIDLVDAEDRAELALFAIEGDTLTLCVALPGEPRPTSLNPPADSRCWVMIFKK